MNWLSTALEPPAGTWLGREPRRNPEPHLLGTTPESSRTCLILGTAPETSWTWLGHCAGTFLGAAPEWNLLLRNPPEPDRELHRSLSVLKTLVAHAVDENWSKQPNDPKSQQPKQATNQKHTHTTHTKQPNWTNPTKNKTNKPEWPNKVVTQTSKLNKPKI